MGSISALEAAIALGRIRWQGATPSLMGRLLTAAARVQVFVQVPSATGTGSATDGIWLDAEVLSVRPQQVELRTSFARFIAEPSLACRWPLDAPPLTRSELERIFAESVAFVSETMAGLVARFQNDPQLRSAPLEQLMAYSASMRDCATQVQAIATIIESVSQELSGQGDRSMLLVGQPLRAGEATGSRRF